MNPIFARNLVASSQPLAAQAGLQAMAKGGNAVDAALATAITLTVVEPTMNGIGGDVFAMVWHEGRLQGLNGSGRAPAAWTPSAFSGRSAMPERGWGSVTVPGAVSAWVALSKRYGKLPFAELFEAAIRYADEGFSVTPVVARQWAESIDLLGGYPGFREAFSIQGRAPAVGQLWRFPAQARTLESIALSHGESFYRGEIAASLAAFARQTGGALQESDLDAHRCDWVDPLGFDYHKHRLFEIPPNGQGVAAQMALGILDQLGAASHPRLSAERIHLQIEAMRLAFADLHAHVADRASMRIDPLDLLDPAYLGARAELVDRKRAGHYGPGNLPSGGTVYLCTADAAGTMVSLIQSNYKGFGSGLVAPGGIALHNRGFAFSLQEGHPNQIAPGKRPFHTIIPAFLCRDSQEPAMAFGVMGANMQAQGHVQFTMSFVDDHCTPQRCSDTPRWRINDEGQVIVEAQMPEEVVEGLRAMGHNPLVMPPDSLEFGSAQAIARSGRLEEGYVSASDHRRDGQAVGF